MEKKKLKKPLFASFLEKQIKDPQTIKGGVNTITWPHIDIPTTS
ncbi:MULTISPECIES: microviridin/marinostatin family tricyclic proteinase inhibitor [Chryseobacterium]|uniref:Uncharacterized protein n=1 Tax=Chryseobacterium defluvii TaxID=160396 RepID=A0A495SNC6_9FLAO|nr:microviridin/marinostatin family tricyclic proteinase inhibitor [Chryseobacterium defluvii]RKT01547.1 hypothetical protein BCF58_0770 [Chryseobacterium defluvii]